MQKGWIVVGMPETSSRLLARRWRVLGGFLAGRGRPHVVGPLVCWPCSAWKPCVSSGRGAHGSFSWLSPLGALRHLPLRSLRGASLSSTEGQHPLPLSLGWRRRLALTKALNQHWQQPIPVVTWDPLLPWRSVQPACRFRRRCGRLFPRHPRWSGWPNRGIRIGEAKHPGPPVSQQKRERSPPRQDAAPARVFCPVAACPCSDPARARGWATVAGMKHHIDAHLAGSLQGEVPIPWLHTHNRTRCLVCGLSVSSAHGVHPTCRPEARTVAVDMAVPMDLDSLDLPSWPAIQAATTATLRHVPAAARHLWSQVLMRALAAVAHSNTDKAWRELAMLPKCVLCSAGRGGRQHRKATAAYTLDRLQRWRLCGNPAPFSSAERAQANLNNGGLWLLAWHAKGLTGKLVPLFFPRAFALPQPTRPKLCAPSTHSGLLPLLRRSTTSGWLLKLLLKWLAGAFATSLPRQRRGLQGCVSNISRMPSPLVTAMCSSPTSRPS